MCWAGGSNPSLAVLLLTQPRLLLACFAAGSVLTSHVLPFHPGAQPAQPRASADGCFTRGFLERTFLPWKRLPCRACQISWAPSPFRAAAPAATWFSTLSSSKSSPLEPQLWALLLASVPAPQCPGPHYFLVVTAQAGTDEHIPDRLFLVGQDWSL